MPGAEMRAAGLQRPRPEGARGREMCGPCVGKPPQSLALLFLVDFSLSLSLSLSLCLLSLSEEGSRSTASLTSIMPGLVQLMSTDTLISSCFFVPFHGSLGQATLSVRLKPGSLL